MTHPMNIDVYPPLTPEEERDIPRMHPSDVSDQVGVMRKQEDTSYWCADYLQKNNITSAVSFAAEIRTEAEAEAAADLPVVKPINEECRVKMCEWCHQVVEFCNFRRETVGIAMSLVDRYVSSSKPRARLALTDRKEYQLAAMTSLYMAIKLHEPVVMETSLLSELSRGCYTSDDFTDMECDILNALHWRVNGPIPLYFVKLFLALLPTSVSPAVSTTLMDFAQYQTELAVSDYRFVPVKTSAIALSAVLNAMDGIDTDQLLPKDRARFIQVLFECSGGLDSNSPEMVHVRMALLDCFAQATGGRNMGQCVATQMKSVLAELEDAATADGESDCSDDAAAKDVSMSSILDGEVDEALEGADSESEGGAEASSYIGNKSDDTLSPVCVAEQVPTTECGYDPRTPR